MEQILEKLRTLSDAAKYDVSCSSSGVDRKNTGKMGSAASCGICHTWSADGRCISLLKILFTNKCEYDCAYCVNRRSNDNEKASFTPKELADLTMEFYRRNYIEGLFLSSAVERSPDYTAERIQKALTILRHEYGFSGYIHAKIIPGVSPEILHQIGLLADRLSVNIELPSSDSLKQLAPQKKPLEIVNPMRQIATTLAERKQLRGAFGQNQIVPRARVSKERFAPAGQTTQMIIGASPENDNTIIKTAEKLYQGYTMKRVYYSAYIPVNTGPNLPQLLTAPPLKREHRLYQADWLLRFYDFTADEIIDEKNPYLDLELDPKISWALRNLDQFPMEINKVSFGDLLRIPGIGNVSARRIYRQRKMASIHFDQLKSMGVVVKRAKYFITCNGKYYGDAVFENQLIRQKLLGDESSNVQLSLFASAPMIGSGTQNQIGGAQR